MNTIELPNTPDVRTAIANRFIMSHNLSLTQGVLYLKMREYSVIYDSRTHPLSVFTQAKNTGKTLKLDTADKALRKALEVIRGKYNEADRPLQPVLWRTQEVFSMYSDHSALPKPSKTSKASVREVIAKKEISIENRRGIVSFKGNSLNYPACPLWNYPANQVLTLLLRVPKLFACLSDMPEVASILSGDQDISNAEVAKLDVLKLIDEKIGNGILKETLGFQSSRKTTIDEELPKHSQENEDTSIEFQEFQVVHSDVNAVVNESSLNEILPPQFILVKPVNKVPFIHNGRKAWAWIDNDDKLWEVEDQVAIVVEPITHKQRLTDAPSTKLNLTSSAFSREPENNPTSASATSSPASKSDMLEAKLVLYAPLDLRQHPMDLIGLGLMKTNPLRAGQSEIEFSVEGTYTTSSSQPRVLFRSPVMCKQAELGKLNAYPYLVQRKLDGNRIPVFVSIVGETFKITYFSKVGALQPSKFNERFDKEVKRFIELNFKDQLPKNLLLDCECYRHGWLHEVISGHCNKATNKPGFEELLLHCLSAIDLDDTEKVIELNKEQTVSKKTFAGIFSKSLQETELIKVNETKLISSQNELTAFMSQSVDEGYEGLVIYPMKARYTFGFDRLYKIKNQFDGECIIKGFVKAEDPTIIGSVKVEAKSYLGIRGLVEEEDEVSVEFSVSASLTDEYKANSWNNPAFQKCIGKPYTIVCASFSSAGVPIHARFKDSFTPDSWRRDV